MITGKVWLVGAGPGAADLLTLRAANAISRADVLLVDDLVNREVLAHARPTARIVHVGKRGGCRSTPQAFIQRLMLRLARQGKTVARVKGGDPFVFGRGGEELEYLRERGVDCEVVSGITSGIAVPATLGIPVTHRGLAQGVTLITAHTREHGDPDWAALARGGTTLVVYMGLARVARIRAALIAAGMRPDTPVAIIEQGTLGAQRQVVSTLAEIDAAATRAALRSPALIVIGEVVSLASTDCVDRAPRPARVAA